uniref:Uncharacterized protein n=1 Tax=Anguilla anguilla TaxID=7936 RepID=A0A0E9VHB7_ANGAN
MSHEWIKFPMLKNIMNLQMSVKYKEYVDAIHIKCIM